MLNYIKKEISNMHKSSNQAYVTDTTTVDDIPNSTILEYAQLFQELDELTDNGTDATRLAEGMRPLGVDIPLLNDLELETVELSLKNGLVTDVPGDATSPSTIGESYETMKTYDKFYAEAYDSTPRMARETEQHFVSRVEKIAQEAYNEYCVDADEIGAFGFERMHITNERIPSKVNIDFGEYIKGCGKNFISKVGAFFATDKDHTISKRQFDAFRLVKEGAFTRIGDALRTYVESQYVIPPSTSLWDVVTPQNIYVPEGSPDSFCVVLEYMNEKTNELGHFGWTCPVTSVSGIQQESTIDIDALTKINMESFNSTTKFENKDTYVAESAIEKPIRRYPKPSRFFQESIDFGGGDGSSDVGPTDDGSTEVTVDDNSTDTTTETPDTSDTSTEDTNNSNTDSSNDDKEVANVNDVSSQVAEKVAEKQDAEQEAESSDSTTSDGDTSNTDITFDDEFDTSSDDNNSDTAPSVDDQLDQLDNADTTDSNDDDTDISADDIDNEGIENMSLEQILELGSQKLKELPIGKIRDFLKSGSDEAVQEAFILTKNNINKEIDIRLRDVLGILNDDKTNFEGIVKKFPVPAKKLNRALSKGAKMGKVFSTDEVDAIQKLNSALAALILEFKKTNKGSYEGTIKKAITDFTKASKKVAAIVEDKLAPKTINEHSVFDINGEIVQEGLFLSQNNVKQRLANKIQPVYSDLHTIASLYENDKLTKGKIVKMYKPTNHQYQVTNGTYGDNTYGSVTQTRNYETDTYEMQCINALFKILSKILNKTKVQRAFTTEEISCIDQLAEALDAFVDYIEAVIFDKSEDEKIVTHVGKDAQKLCKLLEEVNEICSTLSMKKSRRYENEKPIDAEEPTDGSTETRPTDSDGEPTSTETSTPDSDGEPTSVDDDLDISMNDEFDEGDDE